MKPAPSLCPCGSGTAPARCCGRHLAGEPAPSPEALMRARYSAYVLGDGAYLLTSWHSSTRPAAVDPREGPRWTGLEIRRSESAGDQGLVEFIAYFVSGGRRSALHETSRFRREDGRWFYLDGEIHPAASEAVGRNAACPCGSGRKFKRCCGS